MVIRKQGSLFRHNTNRYPNPNPYPLLTLRPTPISMQNPNHNTHLSPNHNPRPMTLSPTIALTLTLLDQRTFFFFFLTRTTWSRFLSWSCFGFILFLGFVLVFVSALILVLIKFELGFDFGPVFYLDFCPSELLVLNFWSRLHLGLTLALYNFGLVRS